MLLKNDTNFYSSMTSSVRHLASWVQVFDNTAQLATYSKNDALKSWEIQRVGDGSKFFGFGICHRLNVKLRDVERQINITTANHMKVFICPEGYNLDTSAFGFPIFYVSEVHRDENTNELSITAYDRLYKAADHNLSETGKTNYAQPYWYAAEIVKTLGGITEPPIAINFPENMWLTDPVEWPDGGNYSGNETLRSVLDDIAEMTQSIYYLNHNNQLVFKRIAHSEDIEPDFTITKQDYITLDSSTNRRLARIYHTTALGDDTFVAMVESGTTQYIHDNPFWNLRDDIPDKLQEALDNMGGAIINQFTCEWRGYPALEIADKIALVTKDDETVIAYLLNDILAYDGGLTEKTEWAYDDSGEGAQATMNDAASLGEAVNNTAAVVDKINQRIDLIVQDTEKKFDDANEMIEETNGKVSQLTVELESIKASVDETISERVEDIEGEITEITDKVAALEITADAITGNVTKIETTTTELEGEIQVLTQKVEAGITAEDVKIQIQETLEDGVNKVTTTTGFTFNEDGMTVAKSGTQMKTNIDEDGLSIYRNSTEVLTVDHSGVRAENLHATTFLIIGENSRFEDYDNGKRTGCFWIGG